MPRPPAPAAPSSAARALAWAGAAVFVAALLYFFLSYAIRFGEVIWGSPDPMAIAINTGLFSAFALHHSVFARVRVRDWMMRRVPAGLERSIYVWIASLLFIGVCALWRPVAGVAWHFDGPVAWLLRAGMFVGISLTIRAAGIIDILELAGVRQAKGARAADFKVAGPYAIVRHPIYLGWFLIVFCAPTMTSTRLVFAVVSSLYVLIAIPFEERSLRATSGGAYERYMQQVRWRVLPGLY